MMQQIRDSLNGPLIVGVLLAIIGVPFAFSGIQGYFQNDANPAVAKIGDTEITQDQLRRAYDQRYRQLQQLLGENFRADQINPQRMRESVLQDMVQDALLRAQAKDSGFRAGDAALRDYLTVVPAFQDNGKFSTERYRQLLAQNGYTPDSFEAQQRDTLIVDQLRDAVLGSTVVTVDEATLAAKLAKQERDFSYLQFEPSKYLATVNVTAEQIAARYEEKKASLQAPERMKLAYVELAQSKLAKGEAPSADILKTLYEAEKAALPPPKPVAPATSWSTSAPTRTRPRRRSTSCRPSSRPVPISPNWRRPVPTTPAARTRAATSASSSAAMACCRRSSKPRSTR